MEVSLRLSFDSCFKEVLFFFSLRDYPPHSSPTCHIGGPALGLSPLSGDEGGEKFSSGSLCRFLFPDSSQAETLENDPVAIVTVWNTNFLRREMKKQHATLDLRWKAKNMESDKVII